MLKLLQQCLAAGVSDGGDRSLEKRITLTNTLALTAALMELPYIAVFSWLSRPLLTLATLVSIAVYLGVVGLNRLGHTSASRVMLMILPNLGVFLFAAALGRRAGVHLAFFPLLVLPFALFDWKERAFSMLGALLPTLLYVLLELGQGTLFATNSMLLSTQTATIFHLAVALTDFLGLFVCVRAFSQANARSEASLAQSLGKLREEVAERRRVEVELVRAQKLEALGHLVAGVAHEINNPLGFVLSNLAFLDSALREGPASDSVTEMTQVLEETTAGAHRIRHIVRDLRLMVSVDKPVTEPACVNEIVEATGRIVKADLAPLGAWVTDLKATSRALCDPHRLEQVLLNLAVNAVQALDPARAKTNELRIRTYDAPEGVTIEIEDTGSGISAEDLPKIFNPFFTTKPIGTGTGLGLSICHGIIEAANGQLRVKSVLGKGTTFSVVLPAEVLPVTTRVLKPSNTAGLQPAMMTLVPA